MLCRCVSPWRLVADKIDFDGSGPASLFGEVIAFNEKIPNLVAAGGETCGLYLSHDAGDTWELQKYRGNDLCVGERITCLRFEPTASRGENLVVGTFADSEFETLGLGTPFKPARNTGSVYRSSSSARERLKFRWVTNLSLPDFGVTNMGFGTYYCFQSMATTRGVYYTHRNGGIFHQRRVEMPADELYVALGDRRFMKELRPRFMKLRATTYAAPFSSPGANRLYV